MPGPRHRLNRMPRLETFTIGTLAARSGLTPDALRYYERVGVIAPAPRTSGGFRLYTADVLERVRFIKQAQRQGLALADIRDLLRLEIRPGASQCRQMRELLTRKLGEVDARMVELKAFRRALRSRLDLCEQTLAQTPDAACPVVEGLKRGTR